MLFMYHIRDYVLFFLFKQIKNGLLAYLKCFPFCVTCYEIQCNVFHQKKRYIKVFETLCNAMKCPMEPRGVEPLSKLPGT